jgi:hypothetical protein
VIDGMTDEMDLLLTRASNKYVDTMIVAGREVMRGGKVLGVDVDAIEREVLTQAKAARSQMQKIRPVLKRSQATLSDFYKSGGHAAAR